MATFLDTLMEPGDEDVQAIDKSIRALEEKRKADGEKPDYGFALASALISHRDVGCVRHGLELMEKECYGLWRTVRNAATDGAEHNTAATTQLAECCYFMAVAHAKLGDMVKARSSVETMLELQPGHPQGLALRQRIQQDLTYSGMKGLAALATATIGAAFVVSALRRGR